MRTLLLSYGTRGDVLPFLCLGTELQRRGHDVAVLTPPDFLPLAAQLGLDATALGPAVQDMLEADEWRSSVPTRRTDPIPRPLAGHRRSMDAAAVDAMRRADLTVAGFVLEAASACAAERDGSRLAFVHYWPYRHLPRGACGVSAAPGTPGCAPRAETAPRLVREMVRQTRGRSTELRSELGLSPRRTGVSRQAADLGVLELQAYSPALVPGLESWGVRRPLTGFLVPSAEDRDHVGEAALPDDLLRWLDAGPAPVYLGFGSLPVLDLPPGEAVASAVRAAGHRVLLHRTGTRERGREGPDGAVFRLRRTVDLARLFRRCTVAVHHGGAGTTGLSSAAGVPTLVCSVFGDQPFWGDRVTVRGTGAHLDYAALTASDVTRCLGHLLRPEVRVRAQALGIELSAEPPGVPYAVDLLEQHAAQ